MKKQFVVLLCLLLTSLSSMAEDVVIGNIKYSLNASDGTASVISNDYSGDIVIPASATYNSTTYSVTSIGGYAFYNCTGLTSITIPNSVTSIGELAFSGCSGLTSVVSEVETPFVFGNNAFTGISTDCVLTVPRDTRNAYIEAGWTEDVFQGGIVEMGATAPDPNDIIVFADIKVQDICVDNWDTDDDDELSYGEAANVTSLGRLFAGTSISSFDELQFFTGLTSIEDAAFEGCLSLSHITLPPTVTSIGAGAFSRCFGLWDLTIPSGVTSIGNGAFEDCWSLTVTLPSSLTSLGVNAFWKCYSLGSITIPASLTCNLNRSFCECIINSLTVDANNPVYDSRDNCNAIIETATNTLIVGCGSTTIPNTVTSIGDGAFEHCSDLMDITIPSSVTSIGAGAFNACNGLTSITIPSSVTSIGGGAFFTSMVTSYGLDPGSMDTNYYPSQLKSVTVMSETPVALSSPIFEDLFDAILYVPAGCRKVYRKADYWKEFNEIVEMAQTKTSISMGSSGIETYCSEYALDFSGVDGLKAYVVSGFVPSTGTLVLTPVTTVPAGEGLLLKGKQGTYDVPITTTNMYYTNLLTGVTTTKFIDTTSGTESYFILTGGIHGINFYILYESVELAAGMAYLHLPTSDVSDLITDRGFNLDFEDEQTTDIRQMNLDACETKVFYDLQGRRVENPHQGLYIVNGKKLFIK